MNPCGKRVGEKIPEDKRRLLDKGEEAGPMKEMKGRPLSENFISQLS